jgi:Aspartyl protease
MSAAATLAPALGVIVLAAVGSSTGEPLPTNGAGATTASAPIVVPLRLRSHFAIIAAEIEGIDLPLVFDSGDQSTVALQQSIVDKIKSEPVSESADLQFAQGPTVKSAKFRIPRLQIGRAAFTDVVARVDVHDPSYQATDVGQKGFLGTGLLKLYVVVLNYRNRTMTLIPKDRNVGPSDACQGTVVPFAPSKFPAEPVTEVGTDLGKFLVWWDTGSPTSVISKQFVDIARPNQAGDRLTTRRLVLGGKDFGPWPFDVWDITLPPWFSGFLGYNFFARHIVCIDFPGKQIVIAR